MSGARRFTVSTPDWGQGHLTPDAVVAYVDDELAPGARARAETHLAGCPECRAEVVAQRQARAALRAADGPQLPSSLLHSLRAIPVDAELPPMPPGLAVTAEGQFVLLRDPVDPGSTGRPPRVGGDHGRRRTSRRSRFGAVSGLALGALAVGALVVQTPAPTTAPPPVERGVFGGAVLEVPARLSAGHGEPSAAPVAPSSPAPLEPAVIDAGLRERLDRLPAAFRPDAP